MKTVGSFPVILAAGLIGLRLWAAAPPGQYTSQSGMVKDNKSGLTWQQGYSSTAKSREEAGVYCSTLGLGGFSWRLPTRSELETLVDVGAMKPAIDQTAFPETRNTDFWATAFAGSDRLWVVSFFDGSSYHDYELTDSYWVRCVR